MVLLAAAGGYAYRRRKQNEKYFGKMMAHDVSPQIAGLLDLALSILAVSLYRNCNPDSGFGWSVLVFLAADVYLLYYALQKYVLKSPDFCVFTPIEVPVEAVLP